MTHHVIDADLRSGFVAAAIEPDGRVLVVRSGGVADYLVPALSETITHEFDAQDTDGLVCSVTVTITSSPTSSA